MFIASLSPRNHFASAYCCAIILMQESLTRFGSRTAGKDRHGQAKENHGMTQIQRSATSRPPSGINTERPSGIKPPPAPPSSASPATPAPPLPPHLREFFDRLDRHEDRIPLDELIQLLKDLPITLDDVRGFVRYSETTYRRNLLHEGPSYQALVICWKNGQRSPIHDHTGSSCGVKVLAGVMTETIFERKQSGMIYPSRTSELAAGESCGSQDADIHQVSNLQDDGGPLVTLHIYSPALLTMNVYSLTDDRVRRMDDPVYEFCDGGGI
jgi:cysteine dioxygenase